MRSAALPASKNTLAANAHDLKALYDTVVDAASVSASLWFSYLFVLFYLLVAVGGVTHQDLFLQNPVKLPFLGVDLPLVGFFFVGPALLLIVHAYVLLHFVLLGGKVSIFDNELIAQIHDDDVRTRLRRQLPSNIFVQFLAGPREVQTGIFGFLLRLVAQISLVVAPVLLLVFFQLQFLPYQNEVVAWWQRSVLVADIVLLWALWPSISRVRPKNLGWRDVNRIKIAGLAAISLIPIVLVFGVATFPGEWLDAELPSVKVVPWGVGSDKSLRLASLHELLVAGPVDFGTGKPISLWSNRLILPNLDTIERSSSSNGSSSSNDGGIASARGAVSFRARHLLGVVLIGAVLNNADFTAANLSGAKFDGANLKGAKFECALNESNPLEQHCTQLQGASFRGAHLEGASFAAAQVRGASFDHAYLQGASFEDAILTSALLDRAKLQGASLARAQLQAASFQGSELQGAVMSFANLQGAQLQGAQLQGALLESAQLQGAQLQGAQLQHALLLGAFTWRADIRQAGKKGARVVDPKVGPQQACFKPDPSGKPCDWSAESFAELKLMLINPIPQSIIELDPMYGLPGNDENEIAKTWTDLSNSPPPLEAFEKGLADQWRETGCVAEGAPYALLGLMHGLGYLGPFSIGEKSALAGSWLFEEQCSGAHGLSETDRATLRAISDGG